MKRFRLCTFLSIVLASVSLGNLGWIQIRPGITHASTAEESWKWRNLTPEQGPAPEARATGSAVVDPIGRRVIIFGGLGASGFLNDAWAFDLNTRIWKRLETRGTPPSARRGHIAEYDPVAHQMVIWSGQGRGFFDDTWVLNLDTLEWHNVSPPARPRARYGSASVFDPLTRGLVIFAGFTSESRRFNDSQRFGLDASTWTDLTPGGQKPGIRCLHTAAFDSANRRMIIFGGQRSGPLDDLWSFDLNTRSWTELTPAQRPPGRYFANSFVDRDGRFVVFGGQTSNGPVNEVWSFRFDDRQWSRIVTPVAPPERSGAMSAFISAENRLILFGGSGNRLYNDVWELRLE